MDAEEEADDDVGEGLDRGGPGMKSDRTNVSSFIEFDDEPTEDHAKQKSPHWIHSNQADILFGGFILLNCVMMGIETDVRTEANDDSSIWLLFDSLFNIVFIGELVLRVMAEHWAWIRDAWNIFDAILVTIGVLDSWILAFVTSTSLRIVTLLRMFRLLKLLRIMRLLRLVKFLTELRLLILGTVQAMKTTVWGFLLLVGMIYVSALFVTQVVGKQCCDANDVFGAEMIPDYFGTLVRSAFTLFMFTMEFQPDLVRETWVDGPFLTFFLVLYTVFTNLMLLNMVSSVIVECILALSNQEAEREKKEKEESKNVEYVKELLGIFGDIDTDDSGNITWEEFTGVGNPERQSAASDDSLVGKAMGTGTLGTKCRMKPGLRRALRIAGVTPSQGAELFHILDADATGTISKEEFVRGFLRVKAPPESKHILRVECRVDTVIKKVDQVQSALVAINQSLAMLTQDAGTGALGGWGGTFPDGPSSPWKAGPPADTGAFSNVVRLEVPMMMESDYDAVVGSEDGGAAGYLYPKVIDPTLPRGAADSLASRPTTASETRMPTTAVAAAAAALEARGSPGSGQRPAGVLLQDGVWAQPGAGEVTATPGSAHAEVFTPASARTPPRTPLPLARVDSAASRGGGDAGGSDAGGGAPNDGPCRPTQALAPLEHGAAPTGGSLWSRSCCGPNTPPVVGKV